MLVVLEGVATQADWTCDTKGASNDNVLPNHSIVLVKITTVSRDGVLY